MTNLTIVRSSDRTEIISQLKQLSSSGAHFTNGIYALESSLIVPSMLAGFKYINEYQSASLPLVIAINSDESLQALGKVGFQSQYQRALKVACPLSELFPAQEIVIVFYDEATPFELYQSLARHHLTRTLHKWGYGTKENEPKIEGAEFFELVYGFPFPNDSKPLCYADTDVAREKQDVTVRDLRANLIDEKNKLLFDLPESLHIYQAESCLMRVSI